MMYTCPCCGYKTLDEKPPGTFLICHICFWEDDNAQFNNPNFQGGANKVSLKEAQKKFIKFGASEKSVLKFAHKPTKNDEKDLTWKPLK